MENRLREELQRLERCSDKRILPEVRHHGRLVETDGKMLLNLSSNDYLGLASWEELKEDFFASTPVELITMSSSSSRLLTGNFESYRDCEKLLSELFRGRSALIFGSGYHMNTGILPAVSTSRTLIVADKLVHASIIDGMRLSRGASTRFRHNDMEHLTRIIEENHSRFDEIIIVTESVFSMDGDTAPLDRMVELKRAFPGVMLYVDEAHAIGACGPSGLGMAEQYGVIDDIDFLVGTFGKALASVGGYIVCSPVVKEYLINRMRTLIFSTALPPINIMWTKFILSRIGSMNNRREHLARISGRVREAMRQAGYESCSESHIVPLIMGESQKAVSKAAELRDAGFYVLPLRPPTVPPGTARVRFSLTAGITDKETDEIINAIRR